MCQRPKEPTSWTSYSHLFSTFFPTLPLTFLPHRFSPPLHLLLSLPSLLQSILLMAVFHGYSSAVVGGMRPYLFLLCALIFCETERREDGSRMSSIRLGILFKQKNRPLIWQMLCEVQKSINKSWGNNGGEESVFSLEISCFYSFCGWWWAEFCIFLSLKNCFINVDLRFILAWLHLWTGV